MTLNRRILASTLGVAMVASALLLTSPSAQAGEKTAKTRKAKKHLLVVTLTTGFPHDSRETAEQVIEKIGNETGDWDTDFVRGDHNLSLEAKAKIMKEKMTAEGLKKYDAIVFANTTGVLPLPDPKAFLEFIKSGKGFAAMHSGSDTFHTFPGEPETGVSSYIKMLGGEFRGHHSQCEVPGMIMDPKHPAMAPVAEAGKNFNPSTAGPIDTKQNTAPEGKTWRVFDEMYLFKNVDRENMHVLLWLDKGFNDGSKEAGVSGEYLISWVKTFGKGKVFYTSLGHRREMWRDRFYQQHITGGIRYVLGLAKGNAKPNPLTKPVAKK